LAKELENDVEKTLNETFERPNEFEKPEGLKDNDIGELDEINEEIGEMSLAELREIGIKSKGVYNTIASKKKIKSVNPENLQLQEDFFAYLKAMGRTDSTITQYKANLRVFWIWNLENNNNQFFTDIATNTFLRFHTFAIKNWNWSQGRLITVNHALRSLGLYVETILDIEFPDYKSAVPKLRHKKKKDKVAQPLSADELQYLLNTLVEEGDYRSACMLALVMYSGCRKAALNNFKISYFSRNNLVYDNILFKTPEPVRRQSRNTIGEVYVFAKPFMKYLSLYVDSLKGEGYTGKYLFPKKDIYTNTWLDEPPVRVDSLTITRKFSKILGKPFTWEDVRYFFAAKAAESDLPDSLIYEMVGANCIEFVRSYQGDPSGKTVKEKEVKTVKNQTIKVIK